MALPQINVSLKYNGKIPSTGIEYTYRPFLVKEQKVLLIALESQDEKSILQSVVDTIEACTYEDIKVNELATFDVEYMFTQIRAKSAGETTKVTIKCTDCEEYTEVTVPLDKIEIEVPKGENLIQLTDQYTVKMRYPSYKHLSTISELKTDTLTEGMYEMIVACLDSLQTEEDSVSFLDESRADIDNFLNNLNNDQFDKLVSFVTDLPKMEHDIVFDCQSCGVNNKQVLQGIQDFF